MILITGATGFIGSHLVEKLLEGESRISCLVRKKNKLGFLKELPKQKFKKINIIYGDLLDKHSLEKALENITKVYHLAAISKPMNIPKHVYYDVNVKGTKNLLDACKNNKVKKMVLISSMSVFGFSRDGNPLNENSPQLPVSDYGKSKLLEEKLVLDFCKNNKIKLVVVRPPMVFGPRDLQFLKLFRLINTGCFPLLKKGRARFEFTYVKNLVNGILMADEKGKNLESYNINDGKTYTIKKVFDTIAELERKRLFPVSIPVWSVRLAGLFFEKSCALLGKKAIFSSGTALWMSRDNIMDISKAKEELGYKNEIPLKESIKETISWYKKEGLL